MKEIVVVSGKGGTGKTSLVASLAALARNVVLADCDVDAADLPLLLSPQIRRTESFRGGHEAVIRTEACIGCGACLALCRFGAVIRTQAADDLLGGMDTSCHDCPEGCSRACPARFADMIEAMETACGHPNEPRFAIDPTACEGCGVCVTQCPVHAIDFPERVSGEWFVSDTRFGPMVHARLAAGGENSGKLVSLVRTAARTITAERQADLLLTDGPPGTGCAAIAALTGASRVLVVTEPTPSGAHDLARVLQLTGHFKLPTSVCVNKWDLNPEMAGRIESDARQAGAKIAGRIRYDRIATRAQRRGLSIVEADPANPVADDIRAVWRHVAP